MKNGKEKVDGKEVINVNNGDDIKKFLLKCLKFFGFLLGFGVLIVIGFLFGFWGIFILVVIGIAFYVIFFGNN